MRPRFTLRALFALTTCVALACYWLALPSANARRFVIAIKAQDYASADQMFVDSEDHFLAERRKNNWEFHPRVSVPPSSLLQFVRGRRYVHMQILYGKPGLLRQFVGTVTVGPRGLASPQLDQVVFSGMTIAQN